MEKYYPPEFEKNSFHCPYCNTYSHQNWLNTAINNKIFFDLKVSRCSKCFDLSFWYFKKLIIPGSAGFPYPNTDLKEDIIVDYLEATSIAQKSSRGAAALLRLCLQKICKQLGAKGKNINQDIQYLVDNKSLPLKIQKALDIVRVTGNNAVHPGQIDLKDNIDTVKQLAMLINLIAKELITTPKEIDEMYASLPASQIDAIEKRGKKNIPNANEGN